MTKAVVRYIFSVPLSMFMNVLAYILAPFLALLSMATGPVLPSPFHLFHTADDTLDGGQHQNGWDRDAQGVALWWQRTRWIWRNPSGGFDLFVLGQKKAEATKWISDKKGNRVAHMMNEDGWFFSIQRDIYWSKTKFIKIWVGWRPTPDRDGYRDIDLNRHMLKFTINPFKTGVRP